MPLALPDRTGARRRPPVLHPPMVPQETENVGVISRNLGSSTFGNKIIIRAHEIGLPRIPSNFTQDSQSVSFGPRRHLARDYTPTVNPFQQTVPQAAKPPSITATTSLVCNQDNPLRALLRFSTDAHTFCPMYLSAVAYTLSYPTDVSQYDSATVSSACSCFLSSAGCCRPTTTSSRQSSSSYPISATQLGQLGHRPPEPLNPLYDDPSATESSYYPLEPTKILMSTSTFYQTLTLVNVPVTLATVVSAQTNGAIGSQTGIPKLSMWPGGGSVLAPAVVAMAVRFFFGHLL